MQKQNELKRLPFILIFIFADLILLTVTICLQNYASLGSFMASLTRHIWIVLLIAAFIALILSIILIKNYLTLRTALAEALMVLIFSFWFGIARIPIINDSDSNNSILFITGSIILLVVNIGIQIDLLCAPLIKNFLTTDKKDREPEQTYAPQIDLPLYDEPDNDTTIQFLPADFSKPTKDEERSLSSAAARDAQKISRPVRRASEPEPEFRQTRLQHETLTEEQLQKFREYQAQRRAARLAAAKQMQNSPDNILFSNPTPVYNTPHETDSMKKNAPKNEPLFFKDEF